MAESRSDSYRRLLRIARQLAGSSLDDAGRSRLVDEFLELASLGVELDDPLANGAHATISITQSSRMPDAVARLFTDAFQHCGVDDAGSAILLAASIDRMRAAAIAEDPHVEDS